MFNHHFYEVCQYIGAAVITFQLFYFIGVVNKPRDFEKRIYPKK